MEKTKSKATKARATKAAKRNGGKSAAPSRRARSEPASAKDPEMDIDLGPSDSMSERATRPRGGGTRSRASQRTRRTGKAAVRATTRKTRSRAP